MAEDWTIEPITCEYCGYITCKCQVDIIPKDCILCDCCNISLSDSEFIANSDSIWCEGWLYCMDCYIKYDPKLKIIMKIKEGQNVSHTDLAKPMEMRTW